MNTPLANLMPPQTPPVGPSVNVSSGRKAPKTASHDRPANESGGNPKSESRLIANDNVRACPEVSVKASRDNSGANRRVVGKKGSKGDKTGKKVALAAPGLVAPGLETQINPEVKAVGSVGVFATILQAAGQTGKKAASNAATTKATVSGTRKAAPGVATESKVAVRGLSLVQPAAQPSKPEKTASASVTVLADRGALQKGVAPAVTAKVRPGEGGTARKDASPAAATGKNPVTAPKTGTTQGLVAQLNDQTRGAIQPDVARGSEVLKQSSLASMQVTAPAADKTGRPARPIPGHVARNKVTLQTESSRQAKAAVPTAQRILHKRLGAVSPVANRSARFVVKELTGTGQNRVAGEMAPVETTATQAVRGGVVESGSPVRQIADAFRLSAARNGQKIVIHLNPPELGKVRVMLRIEGNEVRGILDVENPRTLSQLQREAPNIIGRLTDAGIDMKRMELSLTQDGGRDSMRDPAWFSQQYGENGSEYGGWEARRQGPATDETLSGGQDGEGELQPALMTTGDDSINIWI